jgi:inner membrane protein
MTGKTHLAVGLTSGLGVIYLSENVSWLEVGLTLVLSGGAALLPDLDTEGSMINNFLFSKVGKRARTFALAAIGLLLILLQFFLPQTPFWVSLVGIFFIAVAFSPHRGLTHSLLMTVYIWWVAHMAAPELATAIVVGYVSHLIADMLTVSGIPIFWPFPWKLSISQIGIQIKTGSWIDISLGYLCYGLTAVGVVYLFL